LKEHQRHRWRIQEPGEAKRDTGKAERVTSKAERVTGKVLGQAQEHSGKTQNAARTIKHPHRKVN
jgi:hypothetical protein